MHINANSNYIVYKFIYVELSVCLGYILIIIHCGICTFLIF